MRMFYKALRDDVKDELCKVERPDTLDRYMEMTITLDNRLYERRMEKSRSQQTNHQGKGNRQIPKNVVYQPRTTQQSSQPNDPMILGSAVTVRPPTRLTPEERERRQKSGLCWYCGKPNHVAKFCPSRQSSFKAPGQGANSSRQETRKPSRRCEPCAGCSTRNRRRSQCHDQYHGFYPRFQANCHFRNPQVINPRYPSQSSCGLRRGFEFY